MKAFLVFLLIVYIAATCSDKKDPVKSQTANDEKYKIPQAVDGDWETAHVKDAGMDQSLIEAMIDLPKTYQHSILIVKDGRLVYEEYFSGSNKPWVVPWDEPTSVPKEQIIYAIETIHYQASVTKSFVSALIGICIDQGLITGREQKIKDFFPEHADLFTGLKNDINLSNLLTMRSGIRWQNNDTSQMDHYEDVWVEYVLSRPMAQAPGTYFRYNDGLSVLLAEIVRNVSGFRADYFAEQYLFGPLGITDYYWMKSNTNEIAGGWGLYLRPRDMAKFGQLFLQQGEWNGQRIISESWVKESTAPRLFSAANNQYYGYHWWQVNFQVSGRTYETFFAWGSGGQTIYIIRELGLVIVFTAENDSVFDRNKMYIQEYIIPACETD